MGNTTSSGGDKTGISVFCDRPSYHAGDIVRGVVCLQVTEPHGLETSAVELKASSLA